MIHCCPPQNGKSSVYDAVLVQVNQSANPAECKHNETQVTLCIFQADMDYSGYRAAEIRLIFHPAHSHDPTTYAFVLWMSPMSRRNPSTGLHKVSKEHTMFGHAGGIIHFDEIVSRCTLAPVLPEVLEKGNIMPQNSMKLLDSFYINRFRDHSLYAMLAEK